MERALADLGLYPIASSDGEQAITLLAPLQEFWDAFEGSSEAKDGAPDPYDRYSKRMILPIAEAIGVRAAFPSDGPPYPPFVRWMENAPAIYKAPIGTFVHAKFGLWISLRGALIGIAIGDKGGAPSPCANCSRPCEQACPVSAFGANGYDVEACRAYLRSGDVECWQGCLARRSCPAGNEAPSEAPSRARLNFHMRAFCD